MCHCELLRAVTSAALLREVRDGEYTANVNEMASDGENPNGIVEFQGLAAGD